MMRLLRTVLFAVLFASAQIVPAPAWFTGGGELQGFHVGANSPLPTKSFQACTTNAANQSTYSFASAAIGTAGSTRTVMVAFGAEDNAAAFTLSSASIAGTGASVHSTSPATGSLVLAGIFSADVPTGTTATISLTFSETITGAHICVWAVYDLNSTTAVANNNAFHTSANSITLDVNTSANGPVFGSCATQTGVGATTTWTGLSEDNAETSAELSMSPASDLPSSGSTPLGITCDYSGSADVVGATASFR